MIKVIVPDGSFSGDSVAFDVDTGGIVTSHVATVPIGCKAGDVFQVDVSDGVDDDNIIEDYLSDGTDADELSESVELSVQLPEGVQPGESIEFETEDGDCFELEVPTGCHGGMHLTVEVERSTPPLAAAAAAAEAAAAAVATVAALPPALSSSDDDKRSNGSGIGSGSGRDARLYRADELRVPIPEAGYAFYCGQHVTMRRADGRLSNGVVIEAFDTFETLYRCRIGDHTGTLEKNCTEESLEPATPPPGFAFGAGDMVRVRRGGVVDGCYVERPAVLATVLLPMFAEEGPCYRLRLERPNDDGTCDGSGGDDAEGDTATAHTIETHPEEELVMSMMIAPSSAFTIGQLVQLMPNKRRDAAAAAPAAATMTTGTTTTTGMSAREGADEGRPPDGRLPTPPQLARVVGFEMVQEYDESVVLAYRCRLVQDAWGFPAPG